MGRGLRFVNHSSGLKSRATHGKEHTMSNAVNIKDALVIDQSSVNAQTVDTFDRTRGGMEMRSGATSTRVSTVRHVDPLIGSVATYLVETIRISDEDDPALRGDYIFVEVATKEGNHRIVLPPKVALLIANQHKSITGKNRSRASTEQAVKRKKEGTGGFSNLSPEQRKKNLAKAIKTRARNAQAKKAKQAKRKSR